MFLFQPSFELATGLPVWIGYVFTFVFGAVVGSFLNVVIHRVPREESIVFPNSACPNCGKAIKGFDNIPILSWLLLAGKCRNCKEPISFRYPAVELITALLWVLCFWQIGFNAYLPVVIVFVTTMLALISIDAEHMILPNVITYPLLIAALLVRLIFPLTVGALYFTDILAFPMTYLAGQPVWLISLAGAVLGGLFGGGSLWLIGELWKRLRGVDAMGLGDVKMMFGVGALLGWRLTFLAIFIGAFSGAVAGVGYIAYQKDKDLQAQIPFGIFLGIGSIIAILFGESIIDWYFLTFVPQ
ncbi:MAG: prepilin peptidase [Acidobacteria bacterium]|nr:MAG: prepilin peptidase [Acidobacteriota bacterium]REK01509.1 MAG: prepilin peptidase [Acidobacteriota bacterium]REK14465.1 MAG: prepilin peptidase [Acidobacteriota bacterium]REK45180.1 MAG: prepilin peptidase [Acidobacteriota bacterium]